MADTNLDSYSTLYSTNTSNLRQGAEAASGTTATNNDSQYPYPDQDVVVDENGVPIEPRFEAKAGYVPQLQKPDAVLLGAAPDDESNMILEITTRTASVQKRTSVEEIRNRKNRLDANNARQKEAHDKYVRDFIRAMANSKAMAGLKLFIKIAAPIAAAAATVATFGAATPIATVLCAYAMTAAVTESAGGPNVGLAENLQKGIAQGLREIDGLSDQRADEIAGIAAGVIALLVAGGVGRAVTEGGGAKAMSQVLMANPEFAGMIAGNIVRESGEHTDEEASYVEMAVTMVAGLGATAMTVKGTGNGADMADDDEELNAVGKLIKALPTIARYGAYSTAGLAVTNNSVGGAEAGLEYEQAQHEYDMKVNQYGMQLAEKQGDEANRKLQASTRRFSQAAQQAQENADQAVQLKAKRLAGLMATLDRKTEVTV